MTVRTGCVTRPAENASSADPIVSRAIFECDVEVARFLAERKVLRTVQREREHGGLFSEDGGRAVALMHVAIDHGGTSDRPVAQQDGRGDRDVVEDAVAFTAI